MATLIEIKKQVKSCDEIIVREIYLRIIELLANIEFEIQKQNADFKKNSKNSPLKVLVTSIIKELPKFPCF